MRPAPTRRRPAFEQYTAVRRIYPSITFTPDGRSVVYPTDTSGQFNLWRVPARGGAPRQLTAFEERTVRAVACAPDGRLAVTADPDGSELTQIYRLPARGGWPEQWTDAPPPVQHHIGRQSWSPDGSRFAFAANSDDPRNMETFVRDAPTGETTKIFGGDGVFTPHSWSPDGKQLLVVDATLPNDEAIVLVDVHSGEGREITQRGDEVQCAPVGWTDGGRSLLYVSNFGREYIGLAKLDLADDRTEWIETPDWDLDDAAISADGRILAWVVNEDGWARVRCRDLATGEVFPDPDLAPGCATPLGLGLTLSPDGRRAALVWYQPRRPSELFVIDVPTGRTRRLTDGAIGGLRESSLVSPDLVRYRTFDGRDVPAWVYRPRTRGRAPAVLSIHGGPEAQERPYYKPLYQYLVSRGIAVVATNIRGSTGYGKSYQRLIRRDWGGAELRDIERAVLWMKDQPWVDASRVGVYGGSFGGFATLSCVTRLPDHWAAAVDIVGPSNLITFTRAVPPHWKRMTRDWVGDPDEDAELLHERSPITYVDKSARRCW